MATYRSSAPVVAVAFSADSQRVAYTSGNEVVVYLVDLPNDIGISVPGHSGPVTGLGFLPNSKLISTSQDKTVRWWDPSTSQGGVVDNTNSSSVLCMAASKNGVLAYGSSKGSVRLWDSTTESTLQPAQVDLACSSVTQDGSIIAFGKDSGAAALYSLETGQLLYELVNLPHRRRVTHVCFSPPAAVLKLASASEDNMVCVWEVTGRRLLTSCKVRFPVADMVRFWFTEDERLCFEDSEQITVTVTFG
jgi:cytochrome c